MAPATPGAVSTDPLCMPRWEAQGGRCLRTQSCPHAGPEYDPLQSGAERGLRQDLLLLSRQVPPPTPSARLSGSGPVPAPTPPCAPGKGLGLLSRGSPDQAGRQAPAWALTQRSPAGCGGDRGVRLPFHGSLGLVPGCQARLWTLRVGEAVAQARAAGGGGTPSVRVPRGRRNRRPRASRLETAEVVFLWFWRLKF